MAKFKVKDRVKSIMNDRVPAYIVVDVKPRMVKVRPADYKPHDLDHWARTAIFVEAQPQPQTGAAFPRAMLGSNRAGERMAH